MKAYISGIGNISPQNTIEKGYLPDMYHEYRQEYMTCIEPNYRDYIDALARRRMGKVIRMGIVAARMALDDAGILLPDGIITGTGHGSIEETETFLMSMLHNQEKILNPTPFIQATYNSLSTQVAIQLECKAYNSTYVHRGLSFESALLDTMMLLYEGIAKHVLSGGVDEITKNHYIITKRTGAWKEDIISNKDILTTKTKGAIAGEGAVFFVISAQPSEKTYASIQGIKTFHRDMGNDEINQQINTFLEKSDLTPAEIDIFLTGINGDFEKDVVYYKAAELFPDKILAYYKHLCGEYFTSTAFGLWLAASMIKKGHVPDSVIVKGNKPSILKNILLYNRFNNKEHSLILISAVK
jgi:3-oxoacyl-(acyl-carrier-protein) synthase